MLMVICWGNIFDVDRIREHNINDASRKRRKQVIRKQAHWKMKRSREICLSLWHFLAFFFFCCCCCWSIHQNRILRSYFHLPGVIGKNRGWWVDWSTYDSGISIVKVITMWHFMLIEMSTILIIQCQFHCRTGYDSKSVWCSMDFGCSSFSFPFIQFLSFVCIIIILQSICCSSFCHPNQTLINGEQKKF